MNYKKKIQKFNKIELKKKVKLMNLKLKLKY